MTSVGALAAAARTPWFQVVALVWVGLVGNALFLRLPPIDGFAIDTHVYRNALDNMLAGRDAYLVPDPVATAKSGGMPIYFFPPPPAAILGGLMASLPGGIYSALVLNIAALAGAFLVVRRLVPPSVELQRLPWRPLRLLVCAAPWFLFPPSFLLLATGNQNSVFLLCMSLVAYGVLRRPFLLAGVALGVAILLKPQAALFALPLLVSGRWREVAAAVIVAATGVALSAPIVGLKPWTDFAMALATSSAVVKEQGYNMAFLPPTLPTVPASVWMALTAVGMAAAGRLPAARMLSVSIAVFLLGWPVLWFHYGVLALVAIAVLVGDGRRIVGLALAYALFGFHFSLFLLAASIVLLVTALEPEPRRWYATVSARVSSWHPGGYRPAVPLPRPRTPGPDDASSVEGRP